MTLIGLLLAVVMGLTLGLLGGGGSVLAVPILVYAFGFGAKEAVAASLAVVGLTSLFGAAEHWRTDRIKLRVALVFGPIAAAGAYLGAHLAGLLSGAVQLSLFAVVMLVAALFMFRNGGLVKDGDEPYTPDSVGRLFLRLALPGTGIGILTGLVGVGGGIVVVPVLTLMLGVDIRYAIGASIVSVIATSSAASITGPSWSRRTVATGELLALTLGISSMATVSAIRKSIPNRPATTTDPTIANGTLR